VEPSEFRKRTKNIFEKLTKHKWRTEYGGILKNAREVFSFFPWKLTFSLIVVEVDIVEFQDYVGQSCH
jgi:hypothetical protein